MISSLHSWLSAAVFLLGLAAFAIALRGMVGKRPYEKLMWDLAGWFTISLYLQIVLGFFMIFSTTNRSFDRLLGLHMVTSMAAAVLAQITVTSNRRRPREDRRYGPHVWGVGAAMALVIGGILALRSTVFG